MNSLFSFTERGNFDHSQSFVRSFDLEAVTVKYLGKMLEDLLYLPILSEVCPESHHTLDHVHFE